MMGLYITATRRGRRAVRPPAALQESDGGFRMAVDAAVQASAKKPL